MKKLEILAFSAFSAFICAAAFAEPQNVVDRIEETRGTVKTAFDELDKARNFLFREKNSNFALMEDIFSSIKRSKEDLKKEISSFKIRFDADVKNFKDAKTTLEEIEKILPLARKKIESINAAIEKMRAECRFGGADSVIEAAGTPASFRLAWEAARPASTVTVVAMYDEAQTLPLPEMYGKNLTFKTGGVDGCDGEDILAHIAAGKLDTSALITHTFPLSRADEAYKLFEARADGVMKVALNCTR